MNKDKLQRTPRAAEEKGDLYYWSKKPCSKGHDDVRYTRSGQCRQCLREYHQKPHIREYQRKYHEDYRNNPNKKGVYEQSRIRYTVKKKFDGDWEAYNKWRKEIDAKSQKRQAKLAEAERKRELRREWHHNRSVAKSKGYEVFLGRPCRHGHGNIRRVRNGSCALCDRIKAERYNKRMRELRAAKRKK